MLRWKGLVFVPVAVLAGACGGDEGGGSRGDVVVDDGGTGVDVGDGEAADASFEVLDAPTMAADPGLAWVEVDGQRFDFPAAGAIYLTCEVSPDLVQVNIQTPEGHDLSLVASTGAGMPTGSITVAAGEGNVSYGSDLRGGRLGIGDGAVSYEGPMDKVVDFDVLNAESMDGTLAVNCDTPGGDPTATVGDRTYEFPVSGAQSFDCTVAEDAFEIRINRLAIDDLQLEMQGRDDGTQWVGAVVVYTADGNWTAPLPSDGTGLSVEAGTVTFDGAFVGPDGTEVTGAATATCF